MNYKIGLFVPTWKKNYNKVSASIWIRCFEFAKFLKTQGHDVSINNYFSNYDFSILYRECTNLTITKINYLKKRSKFVFWDTCVNYLDLHSKNFKKRIDIVNEIGVKVNAVICSSSFIFHRHMDAGHQVILFEDCIKPSDVCGVQDKNMYTWCGQSSKFDDLYKYSSLLGGNLTVISDKNFKTTLSHSYVRWNYHNFFIHTSSSNIAFLPRDYKNMYDLGHSSYKALCFASYGVPVIANKLPSYVDLKKKYEGIFFLEEINDIKEFSVNLIGKKYCNKLLRDNYSYLNQSRSLLEFISGK